MKLLLRFVLVCVVPAILCSISTNYRQLVESIILSYMCGYYGEGITRYLGGDN